MVCDQIGDSIENRIITIRGVQVILDRDLAELYSVETKRLNQQANRNRDRFPQRFRFPLSKDEKDELVANCNRFEPLKHSSTRPYAYTEQGVAMMSAVLHTPYAIEISVMIMDAFVAMRHFLASNALVFQRLDRLEIHQLETDHKIEQVFAKLEEGTDDRQQCVFFEGQVYDAYEFVCNLIKSATKRIVPGKDLNDTLWVCYLYPTLLLPIRAEGKIGDYIIRQHPL